MEGYFWPPDKHTLRVCFLNGDAWEKHTVKCTVQKHYNTVPMRIMFVFLAEVSVYASDIRVRFSAAEPCGIPWSCRGRLAEKRQGEVTMSLNMRSNFENPEERRLERQATILHEFGHALGMVHEHQHPDCPVEWNYQVIHETGGMDTERIHHNFDKNWSKSVWLGPYDPKSIMHYPARPGWPTVRSNTRVAQPTVLSDGNKKFLSAVYPLVRGKNVVFTLSPAQAPPKRVTGDTNEGAERNVPNRVQKPRDPTKSEEGFEGTSQHGPGRPQRR